MTKPVVAVTWQDAWSRHEEHQPADFDYDCRIVTYGLLLEDGPALVRVAQDLITQAGETSYRCVSNIPKVLVKDIQVLEIPNWTVP